MALASKLRDEELVVINELAFAEPKTSEMVQILKALNLAGQSVLVTTAGRDVNVWKSARNIDRVSVLPAGDLNALAILQPRRVLITKDALDAVRERARSRVAAAT
jgi:large subunit ribosomal protein L4